MTSLAQPLYRNKTSLNLHKLPAVGGAIRFEDAGLDRGYIDNFGKLTELGLYLPLDPDFARLLVRNGIKHLWLYHRPRRWQLRRYVLDVGALLAWWQASIRTGNPWEVTDESGEDWLLVPVHLLERRRFTKFGGKVTK